MSSVSWLKTTIITMNEMMPRKANSLKIFWISLAAMPSSPKRSSSQWKDSSRKMVKRISVRKTIPSISVDMNSHVWPHRAWSSPSGRYGWHVSRSGECFMCGHETPLHEPEPDGPPE